MPEEAVSLLARAFFSIVRFFGEIVFDTLCGHLGAHIVRILTFGRVRMDPVRGGESVLASVIGLGVLLGVAVLAAVFVLPAFRRL